jgi:hypothetical protein
LLEGLSAIIILADCWYALKNRFRVADRWSFAFVASLPFGAIQPTSVILSAYRHQNGRIDVLSVKLSLCVIRYFTSLVVRVCTLFIFVRIFEGYDFDETHGFRVRIVIGDHSNDDILDGDWELV